jgi:hypothetical protein
MIRSMRMKLASKGGDKTAASYAAPGSTRREYAPGVRAGSTRREYAPGVRAGSTRREYAFACLVVFTRSTHIPMLILVAHSHRGL